MPIYEYKCVKCGKVFSHIHRRLNEDAPPCPDCGAKEAKRKFSTFATGAASPECGRSESCPSAVAGGHKCCAGCCHNH